MASWFTSDETQPTAAPITSASPGPGLPPGGEDIDGDPLDHADREALGIPLSDYDNHHQVQRSHNGGLRQLRGHEVAAACGLDLKPAESKGLIGAFNEDGCIDVWNVGPDEPTSDEDIDGFTKPKRGHGRYGRGQPIMAQHDGKLRPLVDGCGLCSPGRWAPEDRHVDPVAMKLRGIIWD